jgi:hypothetical protein
LGRVGWIHRHAFDRAGDRIHARETLTRAYPECSARAAVDACHARVPKLGPGYVQTYDRFVDRMHVHCPKAVVIATNPELLAYQTEISDRGGWTAPRHNHLGNVFPAAVAAVQALLGGNIDPACMGHYGLNTSLGQ